MNNTIPKGSVARLKREGRKSPWSRGASASGWRRGIERARRGCRPWPSLSASVGPIGSPAPQILNGMLALKAIWALSQDARVNVERAIAAVHPDDRHKVQ